MKKILKRSALFLLLITITFPAFSQFTLGPKIGLNYSNIMNHTRFRAGMDAGIFLRLGGRFYFQPELDYSFRSSTFQEAWQEVESNLHLKTHYFDIPLLFGYKFIHNPNFNFRVFIGPRLGLMIDNSLGDQDGSLKTLQIGGQAGIGIDIWRFTLDFKYDFSANQYEAENNGEWWKQNMFNIALGFKIFHK